jgi:hypothetical protein
MDAFKAKMGCNMFFLSFFILKHKEIYPAVKLNNYVIDIFLVNVLPSHWFSEIERCP